MCQWYFFGCLYFTHSFTHANCMGSIKPTDSTLTHQVVLFLSSEIIYPTLPLLCPAYYLLHPYNLIYQPVHLLYMSLNLVFAQLLVVLSLSLFGIVVVVVIGC